MTALWGGASRARAEHGTVQAGALIDIEEQRYGASLLVDALWLDGVARVGLSVGTGALSNAGEARSNVLGVLGPALWLGRPGPGGLFSVTRVGGFAGGRQGGFLGGLWLAQTLGFRIALGDDPEQGASLHLAAEAWLLSGRTTSLLVSPVIGLSY